MSTTQICPICKSEIRMGEQHACPGREPELPANRFALKSRAMLPRLLREGAEYAECYADFADNASESAIREARHYANSVRILANAYESQEREDGNPYV